MTFTELKAALAARGFNDNTPEQLGEAINDANAELDELMPWPYREKSVIGVAPLTIPDLGQIEQVINVTKQVPLEPEEYRNLVHKYWDLSTEGEPVWYYRSWPEFLPVLATYPTNDDCIGVQYWKITPTLVGGSDTPLSPPRFHRAIVDIAVRRSFLDSENFESAAAIQGEIDKTVAIMTQTFFSEQLQSPKIIRTSTGNF